MATHVYPYVFSFKNHKGTRETRVVLIESSRTRKGDWVIRAQGSWDDQWSTVVNVTKRFGSFLDASIYETKKFALQSGTYEFSREQMGGKLGYSWNIFFWNLMRWSFVRAVAVDFNVRVLEDELYDNPAKIEAALNAIPDPTHVVGQAKDNLSLSGPVAWQYEGLSYGYPYLSDLENILAKIRFKIETNY